MSLLASILARLKENAGKEELPWSDAASVLWSLVAMSPDLDFSEPQICTGFRELVECYALRLERICESMPAWDSKATPPGGVSPVPSPSPVSDTTVDKLEAFERSDLCMLHQFFLSCAIDERFAAAVGDAGCRMHRVRGHFAKVCKQAFVQANMKTTKSDFHTRVYNVLKHGLGLDVEDEFRCMQSGYTVDLKVRVDLSCQLRLGFRARLGSRARIAMNPHRSHRSPARIRALPRRAEHHPNARNVTSSPHRSRPHCTPPPPTHLPLRRSLARVHLKFGAWRSTARHIIFLVRSMRRETRGWAVRV
jgi:hypothetical protein